MCAQNVRDQTTAAESEAGGPRTTSTRQPGRVAGLRHPTRTIRILNLNAVRLKARGRQWSDLVELSAQVADEHEMGAWIRTVLSPGEADNLAPFFTTSRSYFGPLGELVLAESPRDWI